MNARIATVVWLIGALAIGCQSQEGQLGASVSLQRQAEDRKRAIYDEVELIAGAGAEEDAPMEAEDEPYEPEPEQADAGSLEERALEDMSYSDDSPLCGNGELDDGELCDPFIVEGEGVCPEECEPPPGCPDEVLVVRGCVTRCMPESEPSEECLAKR
jgi:hypothetical protein